MSLLDVVKKAALDALAASNPVHLLFGEIVTSSPLSIRVDQRFTLTNEFLVTTAALQELKITIEGSEYVIRSGLQAGDKVLLARVQGGQQYVVLDKVVES